MKTARYRIRQFAQALAAKPGEADWRAVERVLPPGQVSLFGRLHPSEQAHALRVMRSLEGEAAQEGGRDLLAAALLHDIGKIRHPLRLWERVLIVLGRRLLPKKSASWENRPPTGWPRPFVVAAHHPAWGAEIAAETGASSLTVALIRRHQDEIPGAPRTAEDRMLARLQKADGAN